MNFYIYVMKLAVFGRKISRFFSWVSIKHNNFKFPPCFFSKKNKVKNKLPSL